MIAQDGIPEAWPALLTREQLCAYVGVCDNTLRKVCTVPPVDLGANVLRYRRTDIDAWLSRLDHRLPGRRPNAQDAPAGDGDQWPPVPANDRASAAVARAKQRAAARE